MKNIPFRLLSFLIVLLAFSACDPTENPASLPVLTTGDPSLITETTIRSGGNILSDAGLKVTERGICYSKNNTVPTILGSKTSDGTGTGTFTSTITGLSPETEYYIRAYATTSAGTGYGNVIRVTTLAPAEDVVDNDGNIIKTVNIGGQTWMVENLKSIRYRTGEMISKVEKSSYWTTAAYGACCYYNNDTTNAVYGMLYNFAAIVDTRKITPAGWHVATNDDWTKLINFLGADSAGAKLKEMGLTHWSLPNTGAKDAVKFGALPGGLRNPDGTFGDIHDIGYWWTSTEYDTDNARYWYLNYNKVNAHKDYDSKKYGRSVRCVKDAD